MHRILAMTIALVASCICCAAMPGVTFDSIVARFATQARLYPQEKVYLHIDHCQCARGERVNYRAYCVNAISHEPMDTSRFVYVELIDGNGKLLSRNKNVNDYGCATGYLTIPKDTKAGICFIRAYTRRSAGDNASFASVIPIMVSARQQNGMPRFIDDSEPSDCKVIDGDQQGMTLTCADSTLQIRVGADFVGHQQLSLVLLNRLVPFYFKDVAPSELINVRGDKLPLGISHALVINSNYDIVARATFVRMDDFDADNGSCPVEINVSEQDYVQQIDVSLPGLQANEQAQLSIGVSRVMPFDWHRDIGYDLNVVAEVPMGMGWITPEDSASHLSQFLSENPVGRFDLQRALHGEYELPVTDVEVTTTVTGTAQTLLLHHPLKNAVISCISPSAGVFSSTVTDDRGRFTLGGLDVVGNNEFVVQAHDEKGGADVFLQVDSITFPPTGQSRIEREPFVVSNASNEALTVSQWVEVKDDDVEPIVGDGTVVLPNLEVLGFRLGHQGGEASDFSAFSDFTFTGSQIEKFSPSSIHDIIRRLPGVFYKLSKDMQPEVYIRASTSIYGDTPALIVIDGMPGELDDINIYEVERVDIFKSGSTVFWGSKGAGGVISIRTKRGFQPQGKNHPNVATVTPLGIQRPMPVKLDNNSKVLYWNPDIVLAAGEGQDARYHLDVTLPPDGSYELVVEGVTSTGLTIHSRLPIGNSNKQPTPAVALP